MSGDDAHLARCAGRRVFQSAAHVTAAWLSQTLGEPVESVQVLPGTGNWSQQAALEVSLRGGAQRCLRLKVCLGTTFGCSEVDYYTRDYVDLAGAPLVRCLDAAFEPGVGYHLLLDDLSATHTDRRDAAPTLDHGLALAEALATLHRHHWQSQPAPEPATLDRYFDEIRPGIQALEQATGLAVQARHARHEAAFRQRWADPRGMTLLHGDVNPTNVLTPKAAEGPVLILDRQPFDWSLAYGLAVYDLAYATVPWWPGAAFQAHALAALRHWHDCVGRADYPWEQALADWHLSVQQCLDVPLEWCSKPDTLTGMRWLWEAQLARVEAATAQPTTQA
jgi:hypothetical protein